MRNEETSEVDMEYTVIRALSRESVVRMVNDLLHGGWRPQGGLVVTPSGEFFQALVMEKKND